VRVDLEALTRVVHARLSAAAPKPESRHAAQRSVGFQKGHA
jgi:hypothetical protein